MMKTKPLRSLKSLIFRLFVFYHLGLSNLLIKLLSFKRLVRLISNSEVECHAALSPKTADRIRYIGHTVASVSRRTPWRSMCFEQALAAAFILKMLRIPHSIYFGLNNDDHILRAHAWSRAGGIFVTGFSDHMDFTAVSVYHYISKRDRLIYV